MEHPGLRGLSILVVENELLIAMDIAKALETAGVRVAYYREPGMIHGYFGMGAASPAAEQARQRATAEFKAMLGN